MGKHQKIVAGGGATEMRLSKFLRDAAGNLMGKEQMVFYAIAKAFEVIPRTLCDNAGFDANNILSKLRQKHAEKPARAPTLASTFSPRELPTTLPPARWNQPWSRSTPSQQLLKPPASSSPSTKQSSTPRRRQSRAAACRKAGVAECP